MPSEDDMDEKFWAEVERARRMSPSERASEGFRLREEWFAQLLVDIKAEFPDVTDDEAKQIREVRMEEMTRQRSEEKSRILEMIAADSAKQAQQSK